VGFMQFMVILIATAVFASGSAFIYEKFDDVQIASVVKVQEANAQCSTVGTKLSELSKPMKNKEVKEILASCRSQAEGNKALMRQRAALGNGSIKAKNSAKKESNE
jgi:hypothetical protein